MVEPADSVSKLVASPTLVAAQALVGAATSVAVLTGAGISTDSGIPDFRGPEGVWTKDPQAEKKSHIDYWINDAEHRKSRWKRMADGQIWAQVEPNAGHRALVALERRGVLHTLVTQNVDGLHQDAGSDPHHVVEVHGTTRRVACLDCGYGAPMQVALDRVRAGDDDPTCRSCGGLLKSATISFGQALDDDALERAQTAAQQCDLLLAIGTSLGVFPIANMVPIAKANGAEIVIVNGEPTGFDHIASVVIDGSISEVLPLIVGGPGG